VPLDDPGERPQVVGGEHRARGVVRAAQQHGAGPPGERGVDRVEVEGVPGTAAVQRHLHDRAPGPLQDGEEGRVGGRGQDHGAAAGVEDGEGQREAVQHVEHGPHVGGDDRPAVRRPAPGRGGRGQPGQVVGRGVAGRAGVDRGVQRRADGRSEVDVHLGHPRGQHAGVHALPLEVLAPVQEHPRILHVNSG
jgi:hypothetical protein